MKDLILWISISFLSCQENIVSQKSSLEGYWQLIGYRNQEQVVKSELGNQTNPLSLRFTSDSIESNLDVNDLFARYRLLNDSTLLLEGLIYTEAVGTPREQKFLDNFPRDTARYRIQADTLMLFPISSSNRTPSTDDTPTVYQRMNK